MYTAYSPDQANQRQMRNAVQHAERWKQERLRQGETLESSYNRQVDALGATICVQSESRRRSLEIIKSAHEDVFRGVSCTVISEAGGRILARFGFEAGVSRCPECDRRDHANVTVRNERIYYHNIGLLTLPIAERFDALENATREAIFEHRRQAHRSDDQFL